MHARSILGKLKKSLLEFPVVLISGVKSAGKTTLVRELLPPRFSVQYVTLDDPAARSAARADPAGFIASLEMPATIDEAHKAPGLFPAMREAINRERIPGSFILTVSAHVPPDVLAPLSGHLDTLTLWPLAQAELDPFHANAVDRLFGPDRGSDTYFQADWFPREDVDMIRVVAVGGYPKPASMTSPRRRTAWFKSYASDMVERDLRDLATLRDHGAVAALLRLAAAKTGRQLSYADLSRSLGLAQTSLKRHFALLRDAFMVWELPALQAGPGTRTAKAPRLMFTDTGLATALLGQNESGLVPGRNPLAGLLENHVANEMAKQATWSETRALLSHLRTYTGQGVGLVLEDELGRMVGVETRATATPRDGDFKGLKVLAQAFPERFRRGIVLHLGRETASFGPNLWALPLSGL